MKKRILTYTSAILLAINITACDNFLDVTPVDKLLEEQVFTNELGIHNALNGVYLAMNNRTSYGADLTMTTVEAIAQRYDVADSRHPFYNYGFLRYTDPSAVTKFENIWTGAFVNILNINALLKGLDEYPTVLSPAHEAIVRGEAIGLRALLHFDLFRLYGPMPGNNLEDTSLPYYDQVVTEPAPLLSGIQFLNKVIMDLEKAESLLSDDPIRSQGVMFSEPDLGGSNFFRYRNYRLNYYAVKALKARTLLYAGEKSAALEAAQGVIKEASQWFPWTDPSHILNRPQAPDRLFSTEIIFGLQNLQRTNLQRDFFSSELTELTILAARPSRLTNTFQANENDYRFNSSWVIPATKPFRTFFKYAEPIVPGTNDIAARYRYIIPMIRKSEMYYIAAEVLAESDPEQSLELINTVRFNRGLPELASGVNLQTEIQREYEKEFYGEGQLFFYYKRRGITAIPNGSANSGNRAMSTTTYMIPIPLVEFEFRNN
ncbi:RagB/SusD family nutrient uptake outer membrane protein [Belliella marina]|uniref:RagB/SusD family nutrient uptake outer membrane protein n=1 Tax=Belliella marina TaxID=1644146 RepID=A0ABW4VSE3_9BACT